jgi:MFS family permease
MDLSSEMIHALLPLYLITVLGASTLTVGVIEGIAEATASITKVFSGALSDRAGKRKWLAALGYGLAAATKPLFPLADSVGLIAAARFADRVGKGIRGAPRDALIADVTPPGALGASYGLRQALDTIGALAGPLAAMLLMWLSANHFTFVLWIAAIPAFLSFGLIAFAVKELARPANLRAVRNPLSVAELTRLSAIYWLVVAIAAIFTLARFSEAFLLLRAQSIGLPLALIPIVMVVMNVVYALSAYPAGALSDRLDRATILLLGFGVLMAADLILALSPGVPGVMFGAALWGLHMGLTQGLFAALVADHAQPELRGTAFGVFNLITGAAMLAASIIAGALWDWTGPEETFFAGAAFAAVAFAGLWMLRRRLAVKKPLG